MYKFQPEKTTVFLPAAPFRGSGKRFFNASRPSEPADIVIKYPAIK